MTQRIVTYVYRELKSYSSSEIAHAHNGTSLREEARSSSEQPSAIGKFAYSNGTTVNIIPATEPVPIHPQIRSSFPDEGSLDTSLSKESESTSISFDKEGREPKQKLNAATSATVIEYVNKTLETVTKNAAIKAVSAISSNGNSNGNNEINTGELPTKV